jgi:hypothetical protein
MKPPFQFERPRLHKRVLFGFLAIFIICFSSVFVALPLIHIGRDFSKGSVAWPLIGFAALSVPFGGLMLWIGFRYRVWVLPYRFTVDSSQNTCGYFWRDSWVGRTDLTGVSALVTAPAYSRRLWPWVIYASFQDGRERKAILNSHDSYSSEATAFDRSFEACSEIAAHLGVPVKFDQWSPEIIRLNQASEQVSGGNGG